MPMIGMYDFPDHSSFRRRQEQREYHPLPPMTEAELAASRAALAAEEAARTQQKVGDAKELLSRLERVPVDTISVTETRRAIRILDAHDSHPYTALAVLNDLDRPFVQGQAQSPYLDPEIRRQSLGAMLGIMIGYNPTSALQVIDGARARPLEEVGDFVARELAIVAVGTGASYGCALAAAKGASAAAAKYTALKTGGVAAGKGVALVVGGGAVATAAVVVGAGCVALTFVSSIENVVDHWNIFEALWYKDRRIMAAIKEGRDPQSNHCPIEERPFV